RRALKARKITVEDLALHLKRSAAYVSQRLNGAPWTQAEMYSIMDLLQIPYHQLPQYFPPGGMYAGEPQDEKIVSPEDELYQAVSNFITHVLTQCNKKGAASK
ncbi:MAG: hypothetical protein ACOX83_10770, partial [Candidatus Spyradocola sp.]